MREIAEESPGEFSQKISRIYSIGRKKSAPLFHRLRAVPAAGCACAKRFDVSFMPHCGMRQQQMLVLARGNPTMNDE
ncbi:hypothetical protein [Herbaspirillum autotrophicum]|uniref:hypothetical protein n=1 Tax=Herbaspirillum autotrophicum TaxID=180195 RepID=UPI00067B7D9E|nr:hypothetical protein [Herbaspirillum autotrophicum]